MGRKRLEGRKWELESEFMEATGSTTDSKGWERISALEGAPDGLGILAQAWRESGLLLFAAQAQTKRHELYSPPLRQ